jgi:hypothetical protein
LDDVVVAFARFVRRTRRGSTSREPKLPLGAEAALWSILEAVPHPTNHLALTRDLSGEVRLTEHERAEVNAAFTTYMATNVGVTVQTSTVAPPAAQAAESSDEIVDVREPAQPIVIDSYYDLGAINENAPLTDNLFTSAEK